MKSKKQREAIFKQIMHSSNLKKLFGLTDEQWPSNTLYKRLHRIETEMHHWAERCCNEDISEEMDAKKESSALKRLDGILDFKKLNIPVIINGDPRGYALKIDCDYVTENNIDIYRDWGNYGILTPEF